ncbi:MAG: Gfo/Idh/MocA family oxidoreductase [Planctomycetaceae bacterium]|nr:Gfo/Idh/MocA family oxidoreductase [Planctomycetaceae bacterium]
MRRPITAWTRRQFLSRSLALGASTFAAPALLRAGAASERVNVAFIGVGGRGGGNLSELASPGGQPRQDVNVVALCDVDRRHLDRAAAKYPGARTYGDFRKLYDDAGDIDAVVVSTAEHTHAYATLPALRLGKHVYCEKPLTHNVVEARLITQAAAQANVATQMGTQGHASSNFRRVVELIQSGAIGPVREAHVWVGRAWGLQSAEEAERNKDIVYVTDRPAEGMTPPEYLDWDLWLGPAPYRPYHEVYFPGPKWYRWWDFGNGTMSDLGSHWNDLPFWALKLDAPLSIEASGPAPHPELAPASMSAVYEYGPRGELPACTLTWHQGTHKPAIWNAGGIPQWDSGILFIGDNGMVLADYAKHTLLPEDQFRDFQRPEPFIADSPGHHEEWLIACKTGSPTGSPFSYAGLLTEANHLGNVAFRAGKKILWDSEALRITNDESANQYLTREPRRGWSLA